MIQKRSLFEPGPSSTLFIATPLKEDKKAEPIIVVALSLQKKSKNKVSY